jgi:CRP/FNR family cyclic AMP-dependent transcriptional regulator
MPATVEQLKRVELFKDLDRKELNSLASSFKERTFNAGETVVSEGSGGVGFFVIDDGQAKVTVHGEERARLGPGDSFGELALIDDQGGGRTASVIAETELRCYGLTSWEFRPLVEKNASIAWKMLQALAKQLREARGL